MYWNIFPSKEAAIPTLNYLSKTPVLLFSLSLSDSYKLTSRTSSTEPSPAETARCCSETAINISKKLFEKHQISLEPLPRNFYESWFVSYHTIQQDTGWNKGINGHDQSLKYPCEE